MSGHVKIVLPCTDEAVWARWTVESILGGTDYPSFEIIISANGDTRTDFSFVDSPACRARVRLLVSECCLGVGNARNAGVSPGDAEYYVFLDAHSLVTQRDWLARLVACLDAHPKASMVQPEVTNFLYDGAVETGAPADPRRVREGHSEYFIRWCWPPPGEPWRLVEALTFPLADEPFEGMAGAGMAMAMRAETFHRLGGFDPEVTGWYYEALDYGILGWLLGYPMIAEPRVRILHLGKAGPPQVPRLTINIIHGILRTAYKYLSPRRRDMAELLFRKHTSDVEVDQVLDTIRHGRWIEERARVLRERIRDDDWLFRRFRIREPRHGDDAFRRPAESPADRRY